MTADRHDFLRSYQILLVEDEPTLQMILGSVLGDAGHEVEAVDNAEDATDRLQEASDDEIDLVLSDKNLPEMNGLDLLDWLREREAGSEKTRGFMLVTGYPSRESALRVLEAGGDGYLVKPFRSLVDAATEIQRVLDATLLPRRQAHAVARAAIAAITTAIPFVTSISASVLIQERPLRLRLEGHLRLAGADLVAKDEQAEGVRLAVASEVDVLLDFALQHPGAGLLLVASTTGFDDLVRLIDAGGASALDPIEVGAAP